VRKWHTWKCVGGVHVLYEMRAAPPSIKKYPSTSVVIHLIYNFLSWPCCRSYICFQFHPLISNYQILFFTLVFILWVLNLFCLNSLVKILLVFSFIIQLKLMVFYFSIWFLLFLVFFFYSCIKVLILFNSPFNQNIILYQFWPSFFYIFLSPFNKLIFVFNSTLQ